MTTLEQTAEHFGVNFVAHHTYRACAILFRAGLAIVLLPLVLVIAACVAKDVGFPLISWARIENGAMGASPRTFKFRTYRIDARNPWRHSRIQSRIGGFLSRSGLDRLPELYFGERKL